MKISEYYLKGRLYPTILTVIPLLVFMNTIIATVYNDTLSEIAKVLPFLTNLGLSAALLFLMVQINRLVSKELFQRILFQDEIKMPTTNHLLWVDQYYDKSVKEKIRQKIKDKFELTLMTEDEESVDEQKARKMIVTAVSQIRNSLRDNKLLLQHNIEYGFFRNLLGGCLIAILFSIIILIYGAINHVNSIMLTGIIMVICYLVPLIFSSMLIKRYADYYSKILYDQFLSI